MRSPPQGQRVRCVCCRSPMRPMVGAEIMCNQCHEAAESHKEPRTTWGQARRAARQEVPREDA